MPSKLPLHEWSVIVLFSLLLLTLAAFAFRGSTRPPPLPLPLAEPEAAVLEIKVYGQVAKPGVYRFPIHATMQDVLARAQPLSSADLSSLNGRRKLRDGQTIRIPERHLITIYTAGAVQHPGAMQILSGTRYCELADQLDILPEADLKGMRKKTSFVSEGDVVNVPMQKKEKRGKRKEAKVFDPKCYS